MARVVIPGVPHHVTQRGVRRMETFFDDEDYEAYLSLMREWCLASGIEIWAYCLMPNHVHLIAVPESESSLARGIGEAHRRYTRHINFRKGWKGYLWQGRFASFPMDEEYLLASVRYVELNPVRAGLVKSAEDYRWSSARAHLAGRDDRLVKVKPMLDRVPDWSELLASGSQDAFDALRMHERTGRPLGDEAFVERMSEIAGRELGRKKPGPKKGMKRKSKK
ncbi:MAG: transposase [Mariprofundaceae bacterium]|nr:transposase [Mariprofundaceae bacterium]